MIVALNKTPGKKYREFSELKDGALFMIAPGESGVNGLTAKDMKRPYPFFIKASEINNTTDGGENAIFTPTGEVCEVAPTHLVIEYKVTSVEEVE